MTIRGWIITCDVCGADERRDPDENGISSSDTPAGWLAGSVDLFDTRGREGQFHGHICAACSALPVRDLMVAWHARREGIWARLA